MALLPAFPWVELRHVGTLNSCQRKPELDRSGKNRFHLGTIVIEKRDLGMELGSTPRSRVG